MASRRTNSKISSQVRILMVMKRLLRTALLIWLGATLVDRSQMNRPKGKEHNDGAQSHSA